MIPIFAWIRGFYLLLFNTSETFRTLIFKGFQEIREHVTSRNSYIIDDIVLNILEWIVTGKYVTTGTGEMEAAFAVLLEKADPYTRFKIKEKLLELRAVLAGNSIPGDEIALDYLINAMFPEGTQDHVGMTEAGSIFGTGSGSPEQAAAEQYSEGSQAPGIGKQG